MAKRILVPLDRRERAEAVLPLVADLARASDATVRLLHVAPLPRFRQDTYGRVIGYADQESDRLEGEGLEYLRAAEAQLEGVPVERRVRFGDAREEILREAEVFGADLIALAATAPGRLRAALSRRVPERVRREAEVAVMLLSPGRDAA